jgi:APA family basic amino acid/polyamine antiporter
MAELKRELGLASAAAIVVGTIIGSGIFLVPRTMVQNVGSVERVFLVWVVGGLLSLAGALTYAELAAMLPEAGGEYVYLTQAYGPVWGYLYGWTQMWVAKSGSLATLATGFFYYLANFWPALEKDVWFRIPHLGESGGPLELRAGQFFAMCLIMGLAILNYFGVKIGGNVQVIVTVAKVSLIAFVIIAGIFFAPGSAPSSAAPLTIPLTAAGFVAALVAALWAYDGWNNVSMVSSEIKNPQRNLPLALIWGTAGVMAIYILANVAYFHVLNAPEVASVNRVAAEMMRRVAGSWGANLVSIAAMISIFAALNGSILTGSRVPYAMARDGLFFRKMAVVNEAHHTPGAAIIGMSAWGALLVFSGRYDQLLTFVIFASWLLYGMTTAAVFVLRRRKPEAVRPYRTIGYPWTPAFFVLAALLIEGVTLYHSPRESILGIVLILAGLPFYFLWKKRLAPGSIRRVS